MTIRKSKKILAFKRPGTVSEVDEVAPEGADRSGTNNELAAAIHFPLHRRVPTLTHLHTKPHRTASVQTLVFTMKESDASLKREPAEIAVNRDAVQKPPQGTEESRRQAADREAIERGEDDGMTVGTE